MKNTHTCNCKGYLEEVGNDDQSRFEHNTTLEHKIAVLKETGAPAELIAKYQEASA